MALEITLRSSGGPNAIVALAGQLERAYSVQDQRATLYTNTGAIAFRFDPTRSLDGLKIKSFVYPDVTNAAMVTTLKVAVELSMQIEDPTASDIMDYQERIEFSGGLPRYVYLPRARGPSTRQLAQSRTPYIAQQTTMIVGRRAPPLPPSLAFPNADILDYRIGKVSPSRLRTGVYREFARQFSVTFISNDQLNAEPRIY